MVHKDQSAAFRPVVAKTRGFVRSCDGCQNPPAHRRPLGYFPTSCRFLMLIRLIFRSRRALAAENLFLPKQLTFYVEPKIRPRPATNAPRYRSGT